MKSENSVLEALVHATTPPEQIVVQKSAIEDLETQLKELEQEAKKVVDATTQFWGNIVQDEQLVQLTTQL